MVRNVQHMLVLEFVEPDLDMFRHLYGLLREARIDDNIFMVYGHLPPDPNDQAGAAPTDNDCRRMRLGSAWNEIPDIDDLDALEYLIAVSPMEMMAPYHFKDAFSASMGIAALRATRRLLVGWVAAMAERGLWILVDGERIRVREDRDIDCCIAALEELDAAKRRKRAGSRRPTISASRKTLRETAVPVAERKRR